MASRSVTAEICNAIRLRHLLRVTYRGDERLVEPYCHGFSADDSELLIVFQRSGGSSSGASTGWKTFSAGELSLIELLDAVFPVNRIDYRRGVSKQLAVVHCCV